MSSFIISVATPTMSADLCCFTNGASKRFRLIVNCEDFKDKVDDSLSSKNSVCSIARMTDKCEVPKDVADSGGAADFCHVN